MTRRFPIHLDEVSIDCELFLPEALSIVEEENRVYISFLFPPTTGHEKEDDKLIVTFYVDSGKNKEVLVGSKKATLFSLNEKVSAKIGESRVTFAFEPTGGLFCGHIHPASPERMQIFIRPVRLEGPTTLKVTLTKTHA